MKKRPTVCTYYFPNWHVDERNEEMHGKGWTEWRVVQYATPRFPGHEQPKVPLWGYDDEANPVHMEKKIKAAADHGIDAFIFDWYYFSDGPYRERCLQEGFLPAANCQDIEFALMWANHNPIYAHPGSYLHPGSQLWNGDVDAATFIKCTDHCIKHYFNQPNYLRVNDGLYFSIFNIQSMVKQLGGMDVAKLLFKDFRHRVEKAGLGKLTLDARVCEFGIDDFESTNKFIKELDIDIASNYIWANRSHDDFPTLDYSAWFERCKEDAHIYTSGLKIPYNPIVAQGWDASPRTVQSDMHDKTEYPFGTIVINNTPELFEKALRHIADFMDSDVSTGSMIHIPCWNEWTEGAYLEPDTINGYGYLEAIKKVFG